MSAILDRDGVLRVDTRRREVWTRDEKKIIDRAARVLNSHGDRMKLVCGSDICPDNRIVMVVDQSDPSGAQLACGCTTRCFSHVH